MAKQQESRFVYEIYRCIHQASDRKAQLEQQGYEVKIRETTRVLLAARKVAA